MYWEDNQDEQRKLQREEKLRQKKGLPAVVKEEVVVKADIPTDQILEVLNKQMEMSADQSKKIDQLSQIILNQQKVIDKIGEQKTVVIQGEVSQTGNVTKEIKPKITKLDDIDVNILDTEGIESVGEANTEVTKGSSIKSQLSKLKALSKNKETNDE